MADARPENVSQIHLALPPWGQAADAALGRWCERGWGATGKQMQGSIGNANIASKLRRAPRQLVPSAVGYAAEGEALARTPNPDAGLASLAIQTVAAWASARRMPHTAGRSAVDFRRHRSVDKTNPLPAFSQVVLSRALNLRRKIPTGGEIAAPLASMARFAAFLVNSKLGAKNPEGRAARVASLAAISMARVENQALALKERQGVERAGLALRAAKLSGPTAEAVLAYESFSKIAMLLQRQKAVGLADMAFSDPSDARSGWAEFIGSDPERARALDLDPKPYPRDADPTELASSFALAFSCARATFRPAPGLPPLAELVDFCDRLLQAGYSFEGSQEQRCACEAFLARAEAEHIHGAVGAPLRPLPEPHKRPRARL